MALPWERAEKEGTEAWEAFCCYRDMGFQRSVRKVALELHKSSTLIGGWSSTHGWEARCRAWDEEIDRKSRDAQAQAIVDMRSRHAAIATILQQKAIDRLQKIEISTLTPRDTLSFIVEAVKIERLSRGETTQNVGVRFDQMTDEELLALTTEQDNADASTA